MGRSLGLVTRRTVAHPLKAPLIAPLRVPCLNPPRAPPFQPRILSACHSQTDEAYLEDAQIDHAANAEARHLEADGCPRRSGIEP